MFLKQLINNGIIFEVSTFAPNGFARGGAIAHSSVAKYIWISVYLIIHM